jgi:hypothetical protein
MISLYTGVDTEHRSTYVLAVHGLTSLLILAHFVEVILVQLTNKTSKVAVFEVLRKDRFRKFLVLRYGLACRD